jgi:DNA polymerase III sliding clamp (beta) subunit (PCNA family)
MKIDRKKLLKGLNIALKVIPKGTALPVLKTVKIDGPGQRLVATDLETTVVVPMKIKDYRVSLGKKEPEKVDLPTKKADLLARAEELGLKVDKKSTVASLKEDITRALAGKTTEEFFDERFCLNAADLKKIVASLEHDTIEIKVSGSEKKDFLGSTLVSVGGHFQDLPMAEVDSFPYEMETEFSGKKKTTISPKALQNLTVATISEDSGFKLSYVCFDARGKMAVATDGHRLHYTGVKTSDSWFLEAGAAKAIAAVAPKDQDIVFMLNEESTRAMCEFDDAKFITVIQDVRFPDYEPYANGKSQHEVTVKKDDVETYLKQAMLMVDPTFRAMKLTFDGSIGVEVRNPERGSYTRTDIPIRKGKVDPQVVVGLNGNFFIDAIRAAEGEDAMVTIGVTDEKSPVYFKHGDFNALVMPMRI